MKRDISGIKLLPTVICSYDDIQRTCKLIIEADGDKNTVCFSIFKTLEWSGSGVGRDWKIIAPDLRSDIPVYKGKTKFVCDNWNDEKFVSEEIEDPTWRDILVIANQATDGHHIYLEALRQKNVPQKGKVIKVELIFGS